MIPEHKPIIHSYIVNEFVEIWIEDGVLIEVFKPEVKELTLKIAQKVVADRLKVSNGITMPILVDMGNVKSIDAATRHFFATPHSTQLLSVSAMLMNNYVAYYAGKLFLLFDKPKLKVELFRKKSDAMNWLKLFVTTNN